MQRMDVACPICKNPVVEESRFCKPHHRAHVSLESAFKRWQLACGNEMNRRSFLECVSQLPETGQKAREVASFLLEEDSP